jgi:hypothetical protein
MTSSADPDDGRRVAGTPDETPTGAAEPGSSSPPPAPEQPAAGGDADGRPAQGEGAPDSH